MAMIVYLLPGTLERREHDLEHLWACGCTGLEERGEFIRAYFDAECELPVEVADGEWTREEEQDWQAEFKRAIRPVQAGKITIVPPWLIHEAAPESRLVIEPGMAFGTGHHATTRMATETLGEIGMSGKTVLDVGTGSGVLAMAAVKLGAEHALGIDIDPQTIPVARENATENGLLAEGKLQFEVGTMDSSGAHLRSSYDVIVANLFAELHDQLAADYRRRLRAGGKLVLTGILSERLPLVETALAREGFHNVQVRTDGEWALVQANA